MMIFAGSGQHFARFMLVSTPSGGPSAPSSAAKRNEHGVE